MPKNRGKSYKKVKSDSCGQVRELLFKENGQEYGIITKMLGGCNTQVNCADGILRIAHIRGTMRNKIRMFVGDLVLLGLREFEKDDKHGDILHKYTPEEHRMLQSYGDELGNLVQNDKVSDGVDFIDEI